MLITSPYSLIGSLRHIKGDFQERKKQMELWKSFFGYEAKDLISLIIDGTFCYYPTECVFKLKEVQLQPKLFFSEIIRREYGIPSSDFGYFSRFVLSETRFLKNFLSILFSYLNYSSISEI